MRIRVVFYFVMKGIVSSGRGSHNGGMENAFWNWHLEFVFMKRRVQNGKYI